MLEGYNHFISFNDTLYFKLLPQISVIAKIALSNRLAEMYAVAVLGPYSINVFPDREIVLNSPCPDRISSHAWSTVLSHL